MERTKLEVLIEIKASVAALPKRRKLSRWQRERLYISGKERLLPLFPGQEETVCKLIARRYRL